MSGSLKGILTPESHKRFKEFVKTHAYLGQESVDLGEAADAEVEPLVDDFQGSIIDDTSWIKTPPSRGAVPKGVWREDLHPRDKNGKFSK